MIAHENYMRRCLELASQGIGNVAPNPMVGSVLVCNDKIIGEGWHRKYGDWHAEVNAIRSVKEVSLLPQSTLYVNLEPCSHYGKTPPCTDIIIEMKIKRVVIGAFDSNPKVAGRGIQKLRDNGVEVITHCLEKESRELNHRFFTFHEKQRPYLILKWAQSADGFIDVNRNKANRNTPTWITDDIARTIVHKWRSEEQAMMVGTNTALMDNPKLNIREWRGKNPVRLVLDKSLRLPKNLHLFDGSQPTIVFTEKEGKGSQNIEYITLAFDENILKNILRKCYEKQITSLIIEGGTRLLQSFIDQNLWDEARIFTGDIKFVEGVKAPLFDSPILKELRLSNSILRNYRNLSDLP